MEGTYEILLGSRQAGKVQVQRQGLFYRFCCRCQIPEGVVYRLQMACGDERVNLGIPVPSGSGFELDTKLPVKRFGSGKVSFSLVPKHAQDTFLFAPVYPEEPFAYLSRLKDGYLMKRNGLLGIGIKERPGC